MTQAPDLVLEREHSLAIILRVYERLEPELVGHDIDIFHDEAVTPEPPVGTGEVRHIDLNVVAVVRPNLSVRLPEIQPLGAPDGHARHPVAAASADDARCAPRLAV